MKIKSIEVESFRGFRKNYRFDFSDVQVLVLYGPNGHGKTSFFDAIEWGLTGSLYRYKDGGAERNKTPFIGHLNSEARAMVKITLEDSNNLVTITRVTSAKAKVSMGYGSTDLNVDVNGVHHSGKQAEAVLKELLINKEWRDKVELITALPLTHVLAQDQLDRFVRTLKGKDRYNAVSVLFGTDDFSQYKIIFQEVKKEIEKQLMKVQLQIDENNQRYTELEEKIKKIQNQYGNNESNFSHDLIEYELKKILKSLDIRLEPEDFIVPVIHQHIQEQQVKNREARHNFDLKMADPLGFLRQNFENWIQTLETRTSARSKLKKLRSIIKIKENIKEVNWLREHYSLYCQGNEQRNFLSYNYQELLKHVKQLEQESNSLWNVITVLRDGLTEVINGRTYDLSLIVIDEFQEEVQEIIKSLKNSLLSLKNLRGDLVHFERSLESAGENLNQLQRKYEQVQVLDQNYKGLLSKIYEFSSSNSDLTNCPVCGTKGITSEHIKHYVEEQLNNLNPQLPKIEKEIEIAKERIQSDRSVLHEGRQTYKKNQENFSIRANELVDILNNKRNNQSALQKEIQEVLDQIERVNSLNNTYLEKVQKFNLNISDLNDLRLEGMAYRFKQEEDHILSELNDNEKVNVVQAIDYWEDKIQEAEVQSSRFINRIEALGPNKEQATQWSIEEVQHFINKTTEELTAYLMQLEKKEKLLLDAKNLLGLFDQSYSLEIFRNDLATIKLRKKKLEQEEIRLQKKIEYIIDVIQNVPRAVDKLNEQAIDKLFDTIQSIFSKINCHPIYRTINYKKDLLWGANNLMLSVSSENQDGNVTEANPSFIFSSAQINSIALSFFLAMALQQKWSTLNMIAMDDPIQNMDDLNIMALTDLLRIISSTPSINKQIIISTHDENFYKLMMKKLRFVNVGVIVYKGYGEEGPVVNTYQGEHEYVNRVIAREKEKITDGLLSIKKYPETTKDDEYLFD